jgi:hypothetical protein
VIAHPEAPVDAGYSPLPALSPQDAVEAIRAAVAWRRWAYETKNGSSNCCRQCHCRNRLALHHPRCSHQTQATLPGDPAMTVL